jgi:hypothetical protein
MAITPKSTHVVPLCVNMGADSNDYRAAERRLMDAMRAGDPCDFANGAEITAEEMASWGPERTIRATLLRRLLTAENAQYATDGIRLRGAAVEGVLDLQGMKSSSRLPQTGPSSAGTPKVGNPSSRASTRRSARSATRHSPGDRRLPDRQHGSHRTPHASDEPGREPVWDQPAALPRPQRHQHRGRGRLLAAAWSSRSSR